MFNSVMRKTRLFFNHFSIAYVCLSESHSPDNSSRPRLFSSNILSQTYDSNFEQIKMDGLYHKTRTPLQQIYNKGSIL